MTDQQTAHRILENVKFKSKDKSEIWALREAQDALLKRSPVKVQYSGDGYSDGHFVYDTATCPSCEWVIEDSEDLWGEPFCPHCGQALDWETEAAEQ